MLRGPVHRYGLSIIQRPSPVNPVINSAGIAPNMRVAEVFAAGQHTAQQDGSIDRRNFRTHRPIARDRVHKVIQETVLSRHMASQEIRSEERRVGKEWRTRE